MLMRSRCLLVWLTATALAVAVGRWSWASVGPTDRFDRLVGTVAALALLACATWAWLVCTAVVVQVLRGPSPSRGNRTPRGVPAWAARVVLTACGASLVVVGPAHAAGPVPAVPVQSLHEAADPAEAGSPDGLPFPDRAVGPAGPTATGPVTGSATAPRPDRDHVVVVVPGDTLWALAAGGEGPGATDAQVAAATRVLHELNRAVVGPDPDLIQPGTRLRAPGT